MDAFEFDLKTKIYFGRGQEKRVGLIVKEYGFKKVLVHYGQGSVVKSGLLDIVTQSLQEQEIGFILRGGAKPNPELDLVKELRDVARNEKVDLILAIGGGSVIDSAKLVALAYYYDGDPFDISLRKYEPQQSLPVGVILTIASAGSETSLSTVVTDTQTQTKVGFTHQLNRPLFSIMNPELTYSVSKYQTAVGIVDILMHSLERYFLPSDRYQFSDYMAEGLIRSVLDVGKTALDNPQDYEARASLMIASTWSHNGLTNFGKPLGMPAHALEHVLSGRYPDVPHGAGLAVLFPAWALYYYRYDVAKFDRFARVVMDSHLPDPNANAKNGILKLQQFFGSLGMPLTFRELGIEEPDIEWMVAKLTKNGTRVVDHFVKPLDHEVARQIYTSCR